MYTVLTQLKMKDNDQLARLPSAIYTLPKLVTINAHMLQYLRNIIEDVISFINKDELQQNGSQMINIACTKLEADEELFRLFVLCTREAGIDFMSSTFASVSHQKHQELCKKVFHARVNGFMSASIEID